MMLAVAFGLGTILWQTNADGVDAPHDPSLGLEPLPGECIVGTDLQHVADEDGHVRGGAATPVEAVRGAHPEPESLEPVFMDPSRVRFDVSEEDRKVGVIEVVNLGSPLDPSWHVTGAARLLTVGCDGGIDPPVLPFD